VKFIQGLEFPSKKNNYRPDIDGLRAVAVLAVIIFHCFPYHLSGGFLGVDVFFAISGYVIALTLFDDHDNGLFSIFRFYARRIRRIFPALAVVLVVSLIVGWFFLFPAEYAQLGKHVAASAAFLANIVYWQEFGYFDTAAETKPLLHLWSLGIEEQFYLFFPLMVAFAWKRLPMLWFFAGVITISFILSWYLSRADFSSAFYLPHARAWQLVSGAFCAYLVKYKFTLAQLLKPRELDLLSIAAACLLLAGFFYVDGKQTFTSEFAILPVAGACILFLTGQGAVFNRILALPPVVFVGLLSFTLYLWHWPAVAYINIIFPESIPTKSLILAVSLTIVGSLASFVWVENPIRRGRRGTLKVAASFAAVALLGVIGLFIYHQDGLKNRAHLAANQFNYQQLEWKTFRNKACKALLGNEDIFFCTLQGNPKNIKTAVIGDSTANALFPGLAHLLSNKSRGTINIGAPGCPPFRNVVVTEKWGNRGSASNCPEIMAHAYEMILNDRNIEVVVFGVLAPDLRFWAPLGADENASIDKKISALTRLIHADVQDLLNKGKRIIVTYDMPYFTRESRHCISRPMISRLTQQCAYSEDELAYPSSFINVFESVFNELQEVCVFHQTELLREGEKYLQMGSDGLLLVRDTHHLTYYGSKKMAERLIAGDCGKYFSP